MQLKAKVEELEYYKREQQLKIDKLNSFLSEKNKEYETLLKDFESNKRQLRECQVQLDSIKDHYTSMNDH